MSCTYPNRIGVVYRVVSKGTHIPRALRISKGLASEIEDIENLDDAFTVIDGEPVLHVGVGYHTPFSR
jgi:hypothetical protein